MIARLAVLAATAAALAVPAAASAAPVSDNFSTSLSSGSFDLPPQEIHGVDPTELSWVDLDIKSRVTWTGDLLTHVGWNTDNVRQGADLAVSRMALQPTGSLRLTWTINGDITPYAGLGHRWINNATTTKEVSCMPQLLGSGYECNATSPKVTVVRTDGAVNSPYVKIWFATRFTITGEGAIVTRKVSLNGAPAQAANNLSLDLLPKLDTVNIPCGAVGSQVSYKLSPYHWTPTVAVKQQSMFEIGLLDAVVGMIETPALYSGPWGKPRYSDATFDLTGSGKTIDLGDAKPNNVPPAIVPFGSISGKAGVPVFFSADTTERCEISSYVWKFSDGTTSYGPTPQRTFKTAGVIDGQLTVTDSSGLRATRSFTVNVSK